MFSIFGQIIAQVSARKARDAAIQQHEAYHLERIAAMPRVDADSNIPKVRRSSDIYQ